MDFWLLTPAQFTLLACAPVLMAFVSLCERQWGARVAGIVAAAPITVVVGLLLVHSDLGAHASSQMALSMAAFVPAQVGIAWMVVALVERLGYVRALGVSTVAFAGFLVALAHVPLGGALGLAVVFLVVGPRLVPAPSVQGDDGSSSATTGPRMIALRAAVSLVTALGMLLVAQSFGATISGAIGAFPIFTFTLCSFVAAATGARGVAQVLAGMVQGLPPYFVFLVVFGVAATQVGAVATCALAAAATAAVYVFQMRRDARRAAPEGLRRTLPPIVTVPVNR